MKQVKLMIALVLAVEAVCSFIELFNPNNTQDIILFLLFTFNMSVILSFALIKSVYRF